VLDAHANEALCDGDRVLGHELLEGHEEAGLDGDAAGDGRGQGGGILGEQVAGDVEQEAQDVGDHGDEQDELGELGGAPRALEVAAAVEDGQARDDQAQHVLLDDGGQQEGPQVERHRLAGHDAEVGHAIADADERLLDLFDEGQVGAQDEVEQREEDERGQQAAGERRQVQAHGGAGGGVGGGGRRGGEGR